MSMFQCQHCGCAENTACTTGYLLSCHKLFDWSGIEDRKGKRLCSACSPTKFSDGTENDEGGKWHGQFPRRFLPKGKFSTNREGNLEHIEVGETTYLTYEIHLD